MFYVCSSSDCADFLCQQILSFFKGPVNNPTNATATDPDPGTLRVAVAGAPAPRPDTRGRYPPGTDPAAPVAPRHGLARSPGGADPAARPTVITGGRMTIV